MVLSASPRFSPQVHANTSGAVADFELEVDAVLKAPDEAFDAAVDPTSSVPSPPDDLSAERTSSAGCSTDHARATGGIDQFLEVTDDEDEGVATSERENPGSDDYDEVVAEADAEDLIEQTEYHVHKLIRGGPSEDGLRQLSLELRELKQLREEDTADACSIL